MISPSVRRGLEGFLVGVALFAAASIAAPAAWRSVSPVLCQVHPPERRFPGFACTVLGSAAAVLWLGPVALPLHVLSPGGLSIGLIRLISAAVAGLFGAGLFGWLGRRKGFWVFLAASAGLLAVSTILTIPLAVF